jgi:hypothetical protein
MPKKRKPLEYAPLPKLKPTGQEPPKPPGMWARVLRIVTCGLGAREDITPRAENEARGEKLPRRGERRPLARPSFSGMRIGSPAKTVAKTGGAAHETS